MEGLRDLTPEQRVRFAIAQNFLGQFTGGALDRAAALTQFVMTGSPAPYVVDGGLVRPPASQAEADPPPPPPSGPGLRDPYEVDVRTWFKEEGKALHVMVSVRGPKPDPAMGDRAQDIADSIVQALGYNGRLVGTGLAQSPGSSSATASMARRKSASDGLTLSPDAEPSRAPLGAA